MEEYPEEIGVTPEIKRKLRKAGQKLVDAGSDDPGVEALQNVLYGRTPTSYEKQQTVREQLSPIKPKLERPPEMPPDQNPEYTYRSHYYRKPGYIYLPSIKKPVKHRPKRITPVNPFKRAKQQFRNAGIMGRPPPENYCPHCRIKTYAHDCPICGRRLE